MVSTNIRPCRTSQRSGKCITEYERAGCDGVVLGQRDVADQGDDVGLGVDVDQLVAERLHDQAADEGPVLGAVEDVVMDQRGEVDEFDDPGTGMLRIST